MSGPALSESGRRTTDQRVAQRAWAAMAIKDRLRVLRRFRSLAAKRASAFAEAAGRSDLGETLSAEVAPLLEACRFLERRAVSILRPRHPGRNGRPVWLSGVQLEILREPFGIVLVIGPSNYPLFLPGTQTLQALAAGNAVIVKPGRGGVSVMELFRRTLMQAGLDPGLLVVTSDSVEAGQQALESDIDKVVLTGSEETGKSVGRKLADRGIPSVMELSGDDSVFVRPGADLDLVARAVAFALRLNNGNTCIVPRRAFAPPALALKLQGRLGIPVLGVDDEAALREASRSGFGLGASVFGQPDEASEFARRLHAGLVVINDIIVPTADPRVPFGGRGRSGFGVTRGAEGLLEMTQVKTIAVRRSKWLPHLDPPSSGDAELFASFIQVVYGGGIVSRADSLRRMFGAAMRRRKQA